MPKIIDYTLVWSQETQAYELYETRHRGRIGIIPNSPAWFVWLDQVSSFAFSGKVSSLTAYDVSIPESAA